jgi:hypothetical protein
VLCHGYSESCSRTIQSLFPGRWPQAAMITYQRLCQSDV